jgi:hypothetical protein
VGLDRDHRNVGCGRVAAVWGPDFVRASNDGNTTTIPSGIFVGLFATIGTWALAKYALRASTNQQ